MHDASSPSILIYIFLPSCNYSSVNYKIRAKHVTIILNTLIRMIKLRLGAHACRYVHACMLREGPET